MRPSTIWYTLKQGVKNIQKKLGCFPGFHYHHGCLYFSCLVIFFSIVNNVNNIAHKVEQEVPITVFFEEGTTNKQIKAIKKERNI